MFRGAVYVYGLAAIATGITDLVWREFDPAEEPIAAFGDNVPGREIYALIVAVALIVGGALTFRRTGIRLGATMLAVVYSLFAFFNVPRFFTAPHYLGVHVGVFVGVLDGFFQQLILVAAAIVVIAWVSSPDGSPASQRAAIFARWIFGLGAIDFGLAHLYGISANATMVPAYMPFGQEFWVGFTGVAFVLSGIAMLSGMLDVLAARLLALMLLVFSVLALPPHIVMFPRAHAAWGINVYNLAAFAAVWIYAEWLALHRRPLQLAIRSAGSST